MQWPRQLQWRWRQRDAELAGLQRHAAELEGHLESVMHEAQEVQQESLDMRDHVVQLEAALRESEAKKCGLTICMLSWCSLSVISYSMKTWHTLHMTVHVEYLAKCEAVASPRHN